MTLEQPGHDLSGEPVGAAVADFVGTGGDADIAGNHIEPEVHQGADVFSPAALGVGDDADLPVCQRLLAGEAEHAIHVRHRLVCLHNRPQRGNGLPKPVEAVRGGHRPVSQPKVGNALEGDLDVVELALPKFAGNQL